MLDYQKVYAGKNAEKISERQRLYREKNAEKLRAYEAARAEESNEYARARYHANADQMRAQGRKWKADNPEWNRAITQEWRDRNKEHIAAYRRKRTIEKATELAASSKKWRLANVEVMREHARRRRAINANSEGQFTTDEVLELWNRQQGKCCYFSICGNRLDRPGSPNLHRDHIEPLRPIDPSRAPGSNTIDNIQLLCRLCNIRKKNKDPYKFTQQYAGTLFPDLPAKGKRSPKNG